MAATCFPLAGRAGGAVTAVAVCLLGSELSGADKSRGHHNLCIHNRFGALEEQSGNTCLLYHRQFFLKLRAHAPSDSTDSWDNKIVELLTRFINL